MDVSELKAILNSKLDIENNLINFGNIIKINDNTKKEDLIKYKKKNNYLYYNYYKYQIIFVEFLRNLCTTDYLIEGNLENIYANFNWITNKYVYYFFHKFTDKINTNNSTIGTFQYFRDIEVSRL